VYCIRTNHYSMLVIKYREIRSPVKPFLFLNRQKKSQTHDLLKRNEHEYQILLKETINPLAKRKYRNLIRRIYPTNPNTTADKHIIVQSLFSVINTRKKIIIKGKLKRLPLCWARGCWGFHTIHRQKNYQWTNQLKSAKKFKRKVKNSSSSTRWTILRIHVHEFTNNSCVKAHDP